MHLPPVYRKTGDISLPFCNPHKGNKNLELVSVKIEQCLYPVNAGMTVPHKLAHSSVTAYHCNLGKRKPHFKKNGLLLHDENHEI